MKAERPAITIRPMTADDLPMLAEWIARPHWQEWWSDPTEEIAHIRGKIEGRDTTRPFIFEVNEEPAGYIQYWFAEDQKTAQELAEHPWLASFPTGSVGIDISIADSRSLSKGLGSATVRVMAESLWAKGHRHITIDPHAENHRAIRAYEKAGFRPIDSLSGQTGDYLIMRYDPENIDQGRR